MKTNPYVVYYDNGYAVHFSRKTWTVLMYIQDIMSRKMKANGVISDKVNQPRRERHDVEERTKLEGETMTAALFECDTCGGPVRTMTGPHRMREFRPGVTLEVPPDVGIATCEDCGETYLTTAEATALEERLQWAYAAYCEGLIDEVRRQAGVTQRELERALGVTPTYLSHITAGRKQASLPLVRLLQAYAVHPDEALRHLRGGDWRAVLQSRPTGASAYQQAPASPRPR